MMIYNDSTTGVSIHVNIPQVTPEMIGLAEKAPGKRLVIDLAIERVAPSDVSGFDYQNQAWVVDGRYVSCGHPEVMKCGCFGRIHAGESPAANAEIH